MPYSRITPTRNAVAALNYCMGKGHNNNEHRNLLVGSVGLLPDDIKPFTKQFSACLSKASSRNKTEARRIIWSFSKDELDPNDIESPNKALTMVQEIMQEYYKGFPGALFVQNDGKGGCIHVHAIVANVNSITGKGFTNEQTKHSYCKNAGDTVASRYIIPVTSEPTRDKITQTERHNREIGAYVWKDDLKSRIEEAARVSLDMQEFYSRLQANGVKATPKSTKKQGDFILYELTDTSNFSGKIPNNLKAKSYKLGTDYDIDSIEARFRGFVRAKPVAAPAPVVTKPVAAPAPVVTKPVVAPVTLTEDEPILKEPTASHRRKTGKVAAPAETPKKVVQQVCKPPTPPKGLQNSAALARLRMIQRDLQDTDDYHL